MALVIDDLFLHSDLSTQNAWLQALTSYLYKEKEVTSNSTFDFEFCWFNRWRLKVQSIFSRWTIQSFYCYGCQYTH